MRYGNCANISVVTIPNIDSAELFTLSLIRVHFTISPSSHPYTPLFRTKDHYISSLYNKHVAS